MGPSSHFCGGRRWPVRHAVIFEGALLPLLAGGTALTKIYPSGHDKTSVDRQIGMPAGHTQMLRYGLAAY